MWLALTRISIGINRSGTMVNFYILSVHTIMKAELTILLFLPQQRDDNSKPHTVVSSDFEMMDTLPAIEETPTASTTEPPVIVSVKYSSMQLS